MTDTTTNEELRSPEDMNTRDMFFFFKEQVAKIDEQLDADSESAGKIRTRNELINEFKEYSLTDENGQTRQLGATKLLGQIIPILEGISDERERYGVYFGVVKLLQEKFSKAADEFVTKITPPPSPDAKLSDTEKSALHKTRLQAMGQLRILKELNIMMKFGTEADFELPKKRTGAHGTRKARQINLIDWTIDGDKLADNKLGAWVTDHGYANVAEFRAVLIEHLKANEVVKEGEKPRADLAVLPDEIPALTLKDGKILTGKKRAEASATPEDESEDDDEDEEDETEDE